MTTACPSRDGMDGDRHVWRLGACVFCGEAEDRGAASWLAENKATIDYANAKSRADAKSRDECPPVVGGFSPWGQIQHVEMIADGLVMVSTPSHGGLWVRPDLEALIPADCRAIARRYASTGWYEEDCDCCIPLALLPGVPSREREYAQRMVRTDVRFRRVAWLLDGIKAQASRMDAGVES